MARTLMAARIAVAALAGGAALAETFHNEDGILFEGTIRLALSDAAACNVQEEKYDAQEYEKLKANQGRPLHVWRVDLSIRNGSGRELDFLRADTWIRSEWPPCTNWDGPSAGALEPFIAMEWADTLEVLSMPYGMRRGQQEGRAAVHAGVRRAAAAVRGNGTSITRFPRRNLPRARRWARRGPYRAAARPLGCRRRSRRI